MIFACVWLMTYALEEFVRIVFVKMVRKLNTQLSATENSWCRVGVGDFH